MPADAPGKAAAYRRNMPGVRTAREQAENRLRRLLQTRGPAPAVCPRPLVQNEPSRRAAARGGVPRPFRLHGGCRFFDREFFFQPWALRTGSKTDASFPAARPASLTLSSAAFTCQRRRGIPPETDAGRYNKKGISVPSLCSCTGGAGCLFSRFSFSPRPVKKRLRRPARRTFSRGCFFPARSVAMPFLFHSSSHGRFGRGQEGLGNAPPPAFFLFSVRFPRQKSKYFFRSAATRPYRQASVFFACSFSSGVPVA